MRVLLALVLALALLLVALATCAQLTYSGRKELMGVMIPDVIRALNPEHRDHTITLQAAPIVSVDPQKWQCSCGYRDVVLSADIKHALDDGLVSRT